MSCQRSHGSGMERCPLGYDQVTGSLDRQARWVKTVNVPRTTNIFFKKFPIQSWRWDIWHLSKPRLSKKWSQSAGLRCYDTFKVTERRCCVAKVQSQMPYGEISRDTYKNCQRKWKCLLYGRFFHVVEELCFCVHCVYVNNKVAVVSLKATRCPFPNGGSCGNARL